MSVSNVHFSSATVTYEHRLNPDNPTQVQVRRVACRHLHPRGRDQRPWRCYMQTNSEADARRILSMLRHEEPTAGVYP